MNEKALEAARSALLLAVHSDECEFDEKVKRTVTAYLSALPDDELVEALEVQWTPSGEKHRMCARLDCDGEPLAGGVWCDSKSCQFDNDSIARLADFADHERQQAAAEIKRLRARVDELEALSDG